MAASGHSLPRDYVEAYTDYLLDALFEGKTLANTPDLIMACLERIANVEKNSQRALEIFAPLDTNGEAGILSALRPMKPREKIPEELREKPIKDWTPQERKDYGKALQDKPLSDKELSNLLELVVTTQAFREELADARQHLSRTQPPKAKGPSFDEKRTATLPFIRKEMIPKELKLLNDIREEIKKLRVQISKLNGNVRHPTYEPIRQKLIFLEAVQKQIYLKLLQDTQEEIEKLRAQIHKLNGNVQHPTYEPIRQKLIFLEKVWVKINRYSSLNADQKAAHPLVLPQLGEAGKQNIGSGFKALLAKIRNFFGMDSQTVSLGKAATAWRDSIQPKTPETPASSRSATPPESPRGETPSA
jgi:hypothetical protein